MIDKSTKQSEITSINGYNEKSAVKHENPPFVPTFYIVKLRLNDTEISPSVSLCFVLKINLDTKIRMFSNFSLE